MADLGELQVAMGPVASHLFPRYPEVTPEEVDLALEASMSGIARAKSLSLPEEVPPEIGQAQRDMTDILQKRVSRQGKEMGYAARQLMDLVDTEKLIFQIQHNIHPRYFGIGE